MLCCALAADEDQACEEDAFIDESPACGALGSKRVVFFLLMILANGLDASSRITLAAIAVRANVFSSSPPTGAEVMAR